MYRNVRRCRGCGIFGWICRGILFWSCTTGPLLTTCLTVLRCGIAELSMGWVDPGDGLSCVGSVWVQYSKSTLKIWKDYVNAFKARLDKIWLHQAVKFVSCIGLGRVGSIFFHLRWVVLGQSADGLGWVGSHKMDPWTTLWYRAGGWLRCSMQSLSSSSSRSSVVTEWQHWRKRRGMRRRRQKWKSGNWDAMCANRQNGWYHHHRQRPLYRSTCVSRYLQLRSGGFCWCKVLLPLPRATSAFGLGRRRWSSPQQCCLHCLRAGKVDSGK